MKRLLKSLTASAACGAMIAGVLAGAAAAQPPPPNYPPSYQGPPPAYGDQPPPPPNMANGQGGYADPALQPPPGYTDQDAQRDAAAQQAGYDRNYAYAAEQWSAANCIRQEQNRTATGAIVGGILGAVIGSAAAGRGSRGAGAFLGGAVGATAGGAIANSQGPGCPPGFVLRPGAPAFYGPPGVAVVYDAPGWYNPWLWYDGRWVYRPYPYHRYWHEHYYRR